jgi:heme A synthase
MTRREAAFLVIGIALGGLLGSLAVPLELLLSVPTHGWPHRSELDAIGLNNGMAFFIAFVWLALLVAGLILLEYRKKSGQISN